VKSGGAKIAAWVLKISKSLNANTVFISSENCEVCRVKVGIDLEINLATHNLFS
jgi:hypothetical protein